MGMNGPIGLNITAIETMMDYHNVDKKDRYDLSIDVRAFANKVLNFQYDYQKKQKDVK